MYDYLTKLIQPPRLEPPTEQELLCVRAAQAGEPLQDIARRLHLSRERVSQLVKKYRLRQIIRIRKSINRLRMPWEDFAKVCYTVTGTLPTNPMAFVKAPIQDIEKVAEFLEQCASSPSETA